jgi:hypothetical protein
MGNDNFNEALKQILTYIATAAEVVNKAEAASGDSQGRGEAAGKAPDGDRAAGAAHQAAKGYVRNVLHQTKLKELFRAGGELIKTQEEIQKKREELREARSATPQDAQKITLLETEIGQLEAELESSTARLKSLEGSFDPAPAPSSPPPTGPSKRPLPKSMVAVAVVVCAAPLAAARWASTTTPCWGPCPGPPSTSVAPVVPPPRSKPMIMFAGSGTATMFLKCSGSLKTDLDRDPATLVLPGGTITGHYLAREFDSHGKRAADPAMSFLGLSVGPPQEKLLCAAECGPGNRWVQLPLVTDFPLGIAVSRQESSEMKFQSEPCVRHDPDGRFEFELRSCVRPQNIRAFLAEAKKRVGLGKSIPKLFVPDGNGGTRARFDEILWPLQAPISATTKSALEVWRSSGEFTMDYWDLLNGDTPAIGFGLPVYNSKARGGSSGSECRRPPEVMLYGVCTSDDGRAPCEAQTIGLHAYTRYPTCSAEGPCTLPPALCGELKTLFTNMGKAKARKWAQDGCTLPSPTDPSLPGLFSVSY